MRVVSLRFVRLVPAVVLLGVAACGSSGSDHASGVDAGTDGSPEAAPLESGAPVVDAKADGPHDASLHDGANAPEGSTAEDGSPESSAGDGGGISPEAGSPEGGSPVQALLFGGETTAALANDTWGFDGNAWSELTTASAPSVRYAGVMAPLGSQVVLFGGEGMLGAQDQDTWGFASSSWTQLSPAGAAPGRNTAAATTLGSTLVLFGGNTDDIAGNPLGDTWTFDGTAWTQNLSAPAPGARLGACMATVGSNAVLFGGYTDAEDYADTWAFDGTAWTQLHPATSPPATSGAVCGTLGGRMILFGGDAGFANGDAGATQYSQDTWAFDGTTWAKLAPATSPPGRAFAAMAPAGAALMLFGGLRLGQGDLGDTWTFDGTTWTQRNLTGPSPRIFAMMSAAPAGQ